MIEPNRNTATVIMCGNRNISDVTEALSTSGLKGFIVTPVESKYKGRVGISFIINFELNDPLNIQRALAGARILKQDSILYGFDNTYHHLTSYGEVIETGMQVTDHSTRPPITVESWTKFKDYYYIIK